MHDQEFQLKLELSEINTILEALGQRPYAQVYALVQKLQQQVHSQMSEESTPQVEGEDGQDAT